VTLCCRQEPTMVLQEVSVEVDRPCELALRALVAAGRVRGRITRRELERPDHEGLTIDGTLQWESLGNVSAVGYACVTEFMGSEDVRRKVVDWGAESSLATDYTVQARPGRRYRLRQVVSVVPGVLHHDPDDQAARLVARARRIGFDALRRGNADEWRELWRARILIDADDQRWQALADAAFFYLNTSVHRSAPASTSIFGLAQWIDYHYYHGLVMWDIETFSLPPLLLLQPSAARALLAYRSTAVPAARENARMYGRRGLQFAWESSPLHGEESMPEPGFAATHEDHGSLDVAIAFAQLAHTTGDERFLRDEAAPVLYGVADWITSRVEHVRGGYRFARLLGIAEKSTAVDDDAYTIMAAKRVLREAIDAAARLDAGVDPDWRAVEAGLAPPRNSAGVIVGHRGFRKDEEQGATPDPLAGFFPLWFDVEPEVMRRTIEFYLDLAHEYIGSPMLSPLYGVWAAWLGDRRRSLRLFDEGYAALVAPRFAQTMEHTVARYPDAPPAGPFSANLGGFLTGLLYGLPGIRISRDDPEDWPRRPVVLPQGWRRIEVERTWVRGRAAHMVAEHGANRAILDVARARRPGATYPIPAIARI
jgi:protein-glucosylgalactosylhydroxylysine glucosidase